MQEARVPRRLTALVVVIAVAASLAACPADPPPKTKIDTSTIVAGVVNDAPGFSVGDLNPAGFDINVMNAIGKGLNQPIAPTFLASRDRQSFLTTGKATIVVATYSITRQRNLDGIDFAGPYMVSPQALIVRADDNRMTSLNDFKGKKICTVATTTGSGVKIGDADMDTKRATTRQCMDLLAENLTDAVFTDALILYGYTFAYQGKFKVIMSGAFGELQYYGVGLLKGRHEDCLLLNKVIQDYLRSQWRNDFQSTLTHAAEAYRGADPVNGDFESVFKPKATDMDALSCKL